MAEGQNEEILDVAVDPDGITWDQNGFPIWPKKPKKIPEKKRRELMEIDYQLQVSGPVPVYDVAERVTKRRSGAGVPAHTEQYISPVDWKNVNKVRRETVDAATCPIVIICDGVTHRIWMRDQQGAFKDKFVIYDETTHQLKLNQLPSYSHNGNTMIIEDVMMTGLKEMFDNQIKETAEGQLLFRAAAKVAIMTAMKAKAEEHGYSTERLKEWARDVLAVGASFCNENHANGLACDWGGAAIRFALWFVEEGLAHPPMVLQEGVTMGGQGHGSHFNTRIIYLPTLKSDELASPLIGPDFQYYEGYLVDFINVKIEKKEPLPTTKIRHDSGSACAEVLCFTHEAKSSSLSEEQLKVVLGCCRLLPYSATSYGIVTTDKDIIWYKVRLVQGQNRLRVKKYTQEFFDREYDDRDRYPAKFVEFSKRLAGILQQTEQVVSQFVKDDSEMVDHPQAGRKNFTPSVVENGQGLFCAYLAFRTSLQRDLYYANAMARAERDRREGRAPHVAGQPMVPFEIPAPKPMARARPARYQKSYGPPTQEGPSQR